MSSAGREKKKARKGSGITKEFAGKLIKNKMEAIAVVAAACIIVILLSFSWEFPAGPAGGTQGDGDEVQTPAEIAGCVADNPDLSQDTCWDLYYHESAVKESDSAKCGLIKDVSIREHCEEYF